MADYLDDLLKFWKKAGVTPAAHRASKAELEAWERRYNVVLPADLRDYVLRVNGLLGGENLEFDHEGLSFLPLSAMCEESEWAENEPRRPGMFIFADLLIKCSWWCAALDSQPHEYTRIYLGGGPEEAANHLLANSLGEFFDRYMHNHMSLHFPDPKRSSP